MKLLPLLLFTCFFFACGPSLEFPRVGRPLPHISQTASQNWFKIILLDVGQGDATLLVSPDATTTLIDTGPPEIGASVIASVLEELQLDSIRTIFISHDHEDHTGSLKTLLQTPWATHATVIDKSSAKLGQTYAAGPATIRVLAVDGHIGATTLTPEDRLDENNLSLALLFEYDHFRYYTEGDLPGGGGNPPYETLDLESLVAPLVGDVDILLAAHHGSHTSTNETLLEFLKPEVALISAGADNDYFHPHPSVIERLRQIKARIFLTKEEGSICIVTDGKIYEVKPYSVDKCAAPP